MSPAGSISRLVEVGHVYDSDLPPATFGYVKARSPYILWVPGRVDEGSLLRQLILPSQATCCALFQTALQP